MCIFLTQKLYKIVKNQFFGSSLTYSTHKRQILHGANSGWNFGLLTKLWTVHLNPHRVLRRKCWVFFFTSISQYHSMKTCMQTWVMYLEITATLSSGSRLQAAPKAIAVVSLTGATTWSDTKSPNLSHATTDKNLAAASSRNPTSPGGPPKWVSTSLNPVADPWRISQLVWARSRNRRLQNPDRTQLLLASSLSGGGV